MAFVFTFDSDTKAPVSISQAPNYCRVSLNTNYILFYPIDFDPFHRQLFQLNRTGSVLTTIPIDEVKQYVWQ